MNESLKRKIAKVKLLVLDVDGVLTDGRIILDHTGREIKNFDVQDGFGIVLFREAGYKTAVLSARAAEAVTARAEDLKIDVICQNAYPKISAYESILASLNVKDDEVCFVGDDLPDLPVLRRAGFPAAVSNAVLEVKRRAAYVTQKKGGRGAVREIIELILKTQGKWKDAVARFR